MQGNSNRIYISKRLKERLDNIPEYPLTTVVAPAGYGKSIAIRYFTDTVLKNSGSLVLWQSVLGSGTADFWRGFCSTCGTVSTELEEALTGMGGPPSDGTTQQEFLRLLRRAFGGCQNVYMVVDDFHLVMNQELYDFVAFCTRNIRGKIHLILISRLPILRTEDMLLFAGCVNELTERELRFSTEDIRGYFARCDCPISQSEATELARMSEGWISVIYLNLKAMAATGRFADAVEIHTMMSEVLYVPLPERQKKLLTTMSLFPEWTAEQAAFIGGCADAEQLLKTMRRNNAFLYYSAADGSYRLHHLLQESVQKVFSDLSAPAKREIAERAGTWFFQGADYSTAADYFYQAGNFEGLMQAVEGSLGARINGEHREKMLRWFRDCPREIMDRHPVALLVFARRLYTFNKKRECIEVFRHLEQLLRNSRDLPEAERRNILGEIEVNKSFLDYNDIAAMSRHHRRAYELMDRPSRSVSPEAPWDFGGVSVLWDYHRKVGALEQEVRTMKESMPYWYRVNHGQGRGAEHLMEAECFLNMGALDEAEICLYRAWNDCKEYGKVDMQVMTACVGIHLELLRGEFSHVRPMLTQMRQEVRKSRIYMLMHTLDMAEAWIYGLMGQREPCAEWIAAGELELTRQLFPATPTLKVVYRQTQLVRGNHTALIAGEEKDRALCQIFPNVLCEIYLDIQLAAAWEALGKRGQALHHLKQALDMALPDRLYLPFVLYAPWIGPLLEKVRSVLPRGVLDELMEQTESYLRRREALLRDLFPGSGPERYDLTERELEVALLAAERKTNREIAQQLFLSENTVKSILRVVFQKMGLEDGGRGKKRELERLLKQK